MIRANIYEIYDRLWRASEDMGEFFKKYQGVGTPLERADYVTGKCVEGGSSCNKCGGVCNIEKRMARYKKLKEKAA